LVRHEARRGLELEEVAEVARTGLLAVLRGEHALGPVGHAHELVVGELRGVAQASDVQNRRPTSTSVVERRPTAFAPGPGGHVEEVARLLGEAGADAERAGERRAQVHAEGREAGVRVVVAERVEQAVLGRDLHVAEPAPVGGAHRLRGHAERRAR
jgi:hypothetical protein